MLRDGKSFHLHVFKVSIDIVGIVALLAIASIASSEVDVDHLTRRRIFVTLNLTSRPRANSVQAIKLLEDAFRLISEVKVGLLTQSIRQFTPAFCDLLLILTVSLECDLVEANLKIPGQLARFNFGCVLLEFADDVEYQDAGVAVRQRLLVVEVELRCALDEDASFTVGQLNDFPDYVHNDDNPDADGAQGPEYSALQWRLLPTEIVHMLKYFLKI